jgi:hypothetical protein
MDSDLRDLPRSHPAAAEPATSPAGRGRAAGYLVAIALAWTTLRDR